MWNVRTLPDGWQLMWAGIKHRLHPPASSALSMLSRSQTMVSTLWQWLVFIMSHENLCLPCQVLEKYSNNYESFSLSSISYLFWYESLGWHFNSSICMEIIKDPIQCNCLCVSFPRSLNKIWKGRKSLSSVTCRITAACTTGSSYCRGGRSTCGLKYNVVPAVSAPFRDTRRYGTTGSTCTSLTLSILPVNLTFQFGLSIWPFNPAFQADLSIWPLNSAFQSCLSILPFKHEARKASVRHLIKICFKGLTSMFCDYYADYCSYVILN
jgi:hypothetical protein